MDPIELRSRHPEVLERLDRAADRADDLLDAGLIAAVRERIEGTLSGSGTRIEPGDGPGQRACFDLVDQMLLDVSSVTDDQVTRAAELLPDGEIADLVTAAYLHEARIRLSIASARLLGGGDHDG